LIWATPLAAQLAPPAPQHIGHYTIEKKKELGLFLAGGVLLSVTAFMNPKHTCPCNPERVNGIDRRFAGDSLQHGLHKASDVLNGMTWAAPFLLDYLDVRRTRQGRFRDDAIVLAESFLLNQAMTQVTKKLVNRPRPFVYGLQPGDPELNKDDSYLSFYSGHTSSAFAISMAYAKTYARRHPGGKRALVYGLAIGAATATGALRIGARKHFPTDVLVGAGSGIAIGLIVPGLH
jgi:hypothetical protein